MKNTHLKILSVIILLCLYTGVNAQKKSDVDKKIEKAEELTNEGKYKDAEKILLGLTEKYPYSGQIWDKLVDVRYDIYLTTPKTATFNNTNFITTDGKGKKVDNDSMTNALIRALNSIAPRQMAYTNFLLYCRSATMHSDDAEKSALYLRRFLIDAPQDTGIIDAAANYYKRAEKEFQNRNYNKAAELYQSAIQTDSTIYKARLYLGDVYYMTKRYPEAIQAFKDAIAAKPKLLEPKKYLSDAYYNSGVYDKAFTVGVEGIITYPDQSMMLKVQKAAKADNHPFATHWLPRDVLPNQSAIADTLMGTLEMPYHIAKDNSPWKYYMEAKKIILSKCDKNGIITGAGDITKQHYMEVYSWEYMISKLTDKQFDFARRMKEKGYLDCYVMVSCFHVDFYEQFRNFADLNSQKIKDYFALLQKENE